MFDQVVLSPSKTAFFLGLKVQLRTWRDCPANIRYSNVKFCLFKMNTTDIIYAVIITQGMLHKMAPPQQPTLNGWHTLSTDFMSESNKTKNLRLFSKHYFTLLLRIWKAMSLNDSLSEVN